jgi:L-fucose mutarotase
MLKGIDPLLNAELLHILRAMGHGDDLALVDRNFPAASVARRTQTGKLVTLDGVDIPRAARAILSVFPLDSFVDHPALRMQVVGKPDEVPEVQRQVQAEIDKAEGRSWPMGSLERFAFYEAAKQSFAVVATGESRGYGCFLLKKGVIF